MNGQTIRSQRIKARRPEIDPDAKRYFVYFALDADDKPLYIGRSCNVAQRLKAHHATLTHPGQRSATWLTETRSLHMTGPYTWDEAVREERRQIEKHQPEGNVALTSRDHRPAIAARRAS